MGAPSSNGSAARSFSAALTRAGISLLAHVVTGARAVYHDGHEIADLPGPDRPRIYFANHRSHGDFVLLWSVLPGALRRRTRPVAGADYWQGSGLRRFIGNDVFNAVLIERDAAERVADPVTQMADAVADGASLILFPEGTRNTGPEKLMPFRTGLFHLADTLVRRGLEADFIPVWIDNLNRVMPKGEAVPVPLLCKVHFGAAVALAEGESKDAYLSRTRQALLALSSEDRGTDG